MKIIPESNLVFRLSDEPIERYVRQASLKDGVAGAFVSFEGWVRNCHNNRPVALLEYECYPALAIKEGKRILTEAAERFEVLSVYAVHRSGRLSVGDLAVWVGVSSVHRAAAFDACGYVIDEIKRRVPIWKKEHYGDGDSGWVGCAGCSSHAHRATAAEARA